MVSSVHVTLIHMELLPLLTPTWMHRLWVKGLRSLGKTVSSLDHCRPARWAANNADVNGCHMQSPWTSPSRVENTPGHRPSVWRTHQDIAHPCWEHTRTSPSRVENTPGHRPPVWRTHQDIAQPCGEHTRTSPTRVENTPGHRPPVWRTHQDITHPCGEHTRTSPTRVENTPGHHPPLWRTHQDIAHPCGEHTRTVSTSLSMCRLGCLFLAHAFVWLSSHVMSFKVI